MTRALALAAVLAVAACTDDTAILVDVSWDPGLAVGADTLRLYVGTGTEGSTEFVLSDDGSATRSLIEVTSPYRYVLRPEGALEDIGQLGLAASLTSGVAPERIVPVAFAAADEPVAFADGELRLVRLVLHADPYIPAGPVGECALWDLDLGAGSIGLSDDRDCDGTVDAVDCAPYDPFDASGAIDDDGDGVTCDDCLTGTEPVDRGGWSIEPGSVFPGQNESAFRQRNQIPQTVDCLHVDFDCSGSCGDGSDDDLSGSDACGLVTLGQDGVSCAPQRSDCDESEPGHTVTAGEGERCDGRDANCDGRPSPPVPCALDLGGPAACRVGVLACNDVAGRYGTCMAETGLGAFSFTETCATLRATPGCLFDDDPLDCATEQVGTTPPVCKISTPSSSACLDGERLAMGGDPTAMGCTWRVVGGMKHADWDVGFVPPDANAGTVPVAATDACAPFLVVRPVNADPVRRTVMIVGESGIGIGARVMFLSLEDDSSCDGVFSCSPALFP